MQIYNIQVELSTTMIFKCRILFNSSSITRVDVIHTFSFTIIGLCATWQNT